MSKWPWSKMIQSLLENSVKFNCVSHRASAKAIDCFAPWFLLIYISQRISCPKCGKSLPLLNTPPTQICELTPESITMNLTAYGSRIEPGKKEAAEMF